MKVEAEVTVYVVLVIRRDEAGIAQQEYVGARATLADAVETGIIAAGVTLDHEAQIKWASPSYAIVPLGDGLSLNIREEYL